jgi:biotin carboxyl carrier protein
MNQTLAPSPASDLPGYPIQELMAEIERLCAATLPEPAFWPGLSRVLQRAAAAELAVILRQEPAGWRTIAASPPERLSTREGKSFCRATLKPAARCLETSAEQGLEQDARFCAVRLASDGAPLMAVLDLGAASEAKAAQALREVALLAHLPAIRLVQQEAAQSQTAVAHFASVLDLLALLNGQQRFLAVAMTLCNELTARHGCERTALGWLEGDYVRVKAISHSEKFERKMEAVQRLEAAMEEALDQDEAIVLPAPPEQRLFTRDHELFAAEQDAKFICSLPLRVDGEPVAVLTCERSSGAFEEVEVRLLALCGELAVRRLADLRRTDRWFGARWALAIREQSARWLGPEHAGAKLLGMLGAVTLLVLAFGRMTYRIGAPFTLRAEQIEFVSAPFNGYLNEALVEPGDAAKKGVPLALLDTRELLLEEVSAQADHTRFLREAEKASAADKPAEMRIAQAQAEQARARLGLARFRREQATIEAPFDGVIVEGDLKKRLGAPVKQGEVLFRFASTERTYVECAVSGGT